MRMWLGGYKTAKNQGGTRLESGPVRIERKAEYFKQSHARRLIPGEQIESIQNERCGNFVASIHVITKGLRQMQLAAEEPR